MNAAFTTLALACAPCLLAADVRDVVPDYDQYASDARFSVSSGTVKAKRATEYSTHVIIEAAGSTQLRTEGIDPLRYVNLRTYQRTSVRKKDLDLKIPADGFAWLLVFDSPPNISLYDFEPRSPLKLPSTAPERARYPVVDVHAHLSSRRADREERLRIMDAANVAIVVDSPMAFVGEQTVDSYSRFESSSPERFLTFATVDFSARRDPGFAAAAVGRLEEDVREFGVVGIGETHDKGSGIFGAALLPEKDPPVYIDDQRLTPVWEAAARLGLPILFHVSDPPSWYDPADKFNEHVIRMVRSPWFQVAGTSTLSIAEMLERRNRVMERIPDLKVIGAHMGSSTEDLAALGETMRKFPNLYVEIGVRHNVLARQPRVARRFFIEFQDRILYGADGVQPLSAYRNQWRIFETDDDSFSTPGSRIDPFYLYGLDLPDVVLRKLYYANAAELMPKVKERLLKRYPDLAFAVGYSEGARRDAAMADPAIGVGR